MDFANDEEIKYAHDVLIPEMPDFDEEKIKVIKSNNSEYIQACPGSGKTTTLLAKLVILANRMPLESGKGVCVLTHTNVAIDEIKAKLGQKADILFQYPNFFGTFQTFIHKFFTNKSLRLYYNSEIYNVDDDIAFYHLIKEYLKLEKYVNPLRCFIYYRALENLNLIPIKVINEMGGKDKLLDCKVVKKSGRYYHFQISHWDKNKISSVLSEEQQKRIINYKENLKKRLCYKELEKLHDIVIYFDNKKFEIDKSPLNFNTETGKELLKIKENLFKKGILNFDEAYKLAFRYIDDINIDHKKILQNRFSHVFIDEMQDCNIMQHQLLDKIFDDSKITVQRFGDYCQAIFDMDDDNPKNEELQNVSKITQSNRFGENIAKVLRTVCIEDNKDLKGNPNINSLKPTIIVYKDPLTVLSKFVDLLHSTIIEEKGMSVADFAIKLRKKDPLHRINIKACGSRAETNDNDDEKICIKSFFPSYEKSIKTNRFDRKSFDSYLIPEENATPQKCSDTIIKGICKILYHCNILNEERRYTKTSLFDRLKLDNPKKLQNFKEQLLKWCSISINNPSHDKIKDLKEEITSYIKNNILPIFGTELSQEANNFINKDDYQNISKDGTSGIYSKDNIEIGVDTVHAVKGETHVATLYLETKYNKSFDTERISEQLKGITNTSTDDKDKLTSLKIAYVGMSRAQYMLCYAINEERFKELDCEHIRSIWNIEYIE